MRYTKYFNAEHVSIYGLASAFICTTVWLSHGTVRSAFYEPPPPVPVVESHNSDRPHSTPEGSEQSTYKVESLAHQSLFGEVIVQLDATVAPEVEIESLPETSLSWTLVGTFTHNATELSSAILITEEGEQERYYPGEAISDVATLRDVTLGNIVIDNDGKLEVLSLYQEREPVKPSRHRVAARARSHTIHSENVTPALPRPSAVQRKPPARTTTVSPNYRTLKERLAALSK